MSRYVTCVVAIAASVACLARPAPAAGRDEEQKLLGVLRTSESPAAKDAACARLKRIGSAKAVPALAGLLADEQLSHSARYALESLACPEAGEALREALGKTKGRTRAGIVESLGDRGEAKAAGALAGLLGDGDAMVAAAAAVSLGKIGGPEAVRALTAAMPAAGASMRAAVADGLLLCADRMLAGGDAKGASAIYKSLYESKQPGHVRTAAYVGLVRAGGDGAAALVAGALAGSDAAARPAALQAVWQIEGQAATKSFAALLGKVAPPVQAALLAGLAQRGDAAAVPAITSVARSKDAAVRLAAIRALGELGDASTVGVLADAAASARGAEQRAARQALAKLRRGKVGEAILAQLPKAAPAAQAELMRALAARREASAVPGLLALAGRGDPTVRTACIRAIGVLADEKAAGKLLALLPGAKEPAVREAIGDALVAIAGRSARREALAPPVLAAMKGADVPVRCTLLRVAGQVGGPEAIKALHAGVRDPSPKVRDAAIRTLAETVGPDHAAELLALRPLATPTQRVLLARGYWRAVGLAGNLPAEKRVAMCIAGLAASERPDERKLALAEVAKIPHLKALLVADSLCDDKDVGGEAEVACVRVASLLASTHPAQTKAVLRCLAAEAKSTSARAEARKTLDALQQFVGYVANWLAAGPYRQKGKECSQLYDVAFPPEKPGATEVKWQPAPHPADASLAWQVDLGPIVGGDHCIVYIRTRVYSPKKQPVRLEIGTDDGIKLWINGKLVHANNAIRGLTPRQDKAAATLNEGWNELLAKITQHTQGCGACLRILSPDGGPIEDLRCNPGKP